MIPGQPASRPAPESAKGRIQRFLKLSQLFERASRATRDSAFNAAEHDLIFGGEPIFQQGAPSTALVVLGRGRARVERVAPDGRVVPLGYRSSGDVLGESCLGRVGVYEESAIALEESEVLRIPASAVEELVAADPAVGAPVLALLLSRKRETEDRIESLLFRNVEGRVVEFLLKAAERWGVPSPRGTLIAAPVTHMEIAQSIGATRETVTLTLGALRREGLLDVTGRRLIIKDREALSQRGAI